MPLERYRGGTDAFWFTQMRHKRQIIAVQFSLL
jgi:hypothetical protein